MAKEKTENIRKRPSQTQRAKKVDATQDPPKSKRDYRLTLINLLLAIFAFMSFRYLFTGYLTAHDEYVRFVGKDLTTSKVVFEVPCSKDYDAEKFTECKPKKCARVVRDDVVSEEDARFLLSVAKRGLALGGSRGGASILDLHSGALSAGDNFVNIYKLLAHQEEPIFSFEDFEVYRKVKNQIHNAIADEFDIPKPLLYLTKPTFFSRMNTTPPSTIHDEYWHPHIDKETYGSFHYTSLLYLSTYGKDFDGGRFVFVDKDSNKTVEPRLGRVSFFTSGSENLHFVERLRDGVRYAITVSFTCDPQQAITDPTNNASCRLQDVVLKWNSLHWGSLRSRSWPRGLAHEGQCANIIAMSSSAVASSF